MGLGPCGYGGPATVAELGEPEMVRFDAGGDAIIADRFDNRVRFVPAQTGSYFGQAMTAGDIYTIAGDGFTGYMGDGGPATSAESTSRAGSVPTPLVTC